MKCRSVYGIDKPENKLLFLSTYNILAKILVEKSIQGLNPKSGIFLLISYSNKNMPQIINS